MTRPGSSAAPPFAALGFAAAWTLLVCRALPLEFAYRENTLGIVSLATQQRYPLQQETFYFVFAVALGCLLAWGFARALTERGAGVARVIGIEALAALALLALVFLPTLAGAAACAGATVAAFALALTGGSPATPLRPRQSVEAPQKRAWIWAAGAICLAPFLAPGVWLNAYRVLRGVADENLVFQHFKFMGETGQHLAWANTLLHGGFQGRDVFCLYGPLYDWGIVAFWSLAGRSIAAFDLYWSLTRVLGWISLLLLGVALLRRRALVLVLPFLLPWIEIRAGLALFALLAFAQWLRGEQRAWCALSGALAGTSLLYSQEFGLAFAIAAAVGFALRRDARAPLLFAAGAAAVMLPLFAYYAAHDALLPMLRDIAAYPSYMLAGYGKLPFPAFTSPLPLDAAALAARPLLAQRLGYAVPLVCVSALLLALPVTALEPRHPLRSLGRALDSVSRDRLRLMVVMLAIFGLISFRSALGRSDLQRTHAVLPAAVLLIGIGLDRLAAAWGAAASAPGRAVAAWRAVALVGFVALAGCFETGRAYASVRTSLANLRVLATRGHTSRGDPGVIRVASWIRSHTQPGEPVLFLPNNGAYYYLTDRPMPIRFVMGHQIVTQAHRDEALADLRVALPRFVVWDHGALRIDGLSDAAVFGAELLAFLDTHYEEATRIGEVEIRRRHGADPQ